MKKLIYLIVLALILGLVLSGCLLSNVGQVPTTEQSGISRNGSTVDYGDITLTGGSQTGHFPEIWDLTAGDMVISFTYDANGLVDDFGGSAHAWAEFGIRTVCYGDFNPTWMDEGAGVWLATDYEWTANTFDPDPVGSPTQDLDDKLILQKGGGLGEGSYNLPSAPPNSWANHAVWFDRDGVDSTQATMWGAIDGVTYNTGGTYDVEITLHADSATFGTAYMTINGEPQGFYVPNWHSGPADLMPAGMTFKGDMTKMQVFYGLYGYGTIHNVEFSDIVITGVEGSLDGELCQTDLIAGNPKEDGTVVGTVSVAIEDGGLVVTYNTIEGWKLYETHLAVADSINGIPTTKKGNPIPGKFEYKHEDLGGAVSDLFVIDDYKCCDTNYFAAHAVVEKIIEPAPRYPSVVVSFNQGLRKNGSAVTEGRSNPLQGLVYEANNVETDFFSLGFGGDIIVEFDCPIPNGEGDDLRIIEDTWGSYPLETAEVYASQDGSTWVPLGEANNTLRETGDNFHSFSAFELGSLEWAKYIKVVDTTNPDIHGETADGFDLNAFEALQDCVQEETAWGEGTDFEGNNWAMYFECFVPCP